MPEWFGCLINLTELHIRDCPILKERCGIEQRISSFSDHLWQWPKICYITSPNIYFDGNPIQVGGWIRMVAISHLEAEEAAAIIQIGVEFEVNASKNLMF